MKQACICVPKYQQGNVIFDERSKLNRDNIFNKYIELRNELKKYNYDLSTDDINTIDESDIIFYFDMPRSLPSKRKIKSSYLVIRESELIRPDNYCEKKHKFFNKIFTWNDNLVDNKKYFKLNFCHLFPDFIDKSLAKKKKLCTLIAGNKKVCHPLELYSKRVEAIRWFEHKHPEEFDLYGIGWDKYRFNGSKMIRALNFIPGVPKVFAKIFGLGFPSYKGSIANKKSVLESFKFSICYENGRDIPGYITEKIFDSFFAGCVPIYWGANNILDYVPEQCFVDKRNFSTYEELYNFINDISDRDYLNYLESIERYLNSEDAFQFQGKAFAKKISSVLFREE